MCSIVNIEATYDDTQQHYHITRAGRRAKRNPLYSFSATVLSGDPSTLQEARDAPDAAQWEEELEREFASMWTNKEGTPTFEHVDKVPDGHRAVKSKLTFKRVYNPNGTLKKHRIRIVARGDLQPWETYKDTYAGTAKRKSIMILLALAAQTDMHIHTADVKSAFLIPELQEEIYMQLPVDYTGKANPRFVRLRRALYGLKQAAHAFMVHLRTALTSLGFKQNPNDQCIYTRGKGENKIYVATHVDDLLILSRNIDNMLKFEEELSTKYEITTEHHPTSYLGMQLDRDSTAGTIKLSLPSYSQKMVDKFLPDMRVKPAATPAPVTANAKGQTDVATPLSKQEQDTYMQLVGTALYLGICTRPDLLAQLQLLTQKMQSATTADMASAKRLLRYVKGTINHGITFHRGTGDDIGTLYAYADSAYGTTTDKKSIHGLCYSLGKHNACFYSTCKKQTIVALSSTEAEYVAASEACRDILWFRSYLSNLGWSQPPSTILFQDNLSCMDIANNLDNNERTKHIDIKYHFIKDHINKGTLKMEYLPTTEMTADILTKALPYDQFVKLRDQLMRPTN